MAQRMERYLGKFPPFHYVPPAVGNAVEIRPIAIKVAEDRSVGRQGTDAKCHPQFKLLAAVVAKRVYSYRWQANCAASGGCLGVLAPNSVLGLFEGALNANGCTVKVDVCCS